jgi:acyl-CoA synthetase (AMP-forming)/AMP-acid ligase II
MKGVMLSHYNLIANTLQYRASLPSLHNGSQREVFFAPCKSAHDNARLVPALTFLHFRLPYLRIRNNSDARHVVW